MGNSGEVVVRQFNSIVNDVALVRLNTGELLVRKRYRDYAIKTGIRINRERIEIEVRLYSFLGEFLKPYPTIRVPKLIRVNKEKYTLYFEFIDGDRIVETPFNDWSALNSLKQLVGLLIDLNELKNAELLELFKDQLNTQNENRNILLNYKFKNNHNLYSSKTVLSLGDISLSNMIYSDGCIYLIDFEFANIGYIGYDLGQLIGHIKSRHKDNNLIVKLIEDILQNSKLDMRMYLTWRNMFFDYYCSKSES